MTCGTTGKNGTTLRKDLAALIFGVGSTLAAALAPGQAVAEIDLTGQWNGIFEFIALGDKAAFGPASVLEGKSRGDGDQPATFGEGEMVVKIENWFDDHFFGRWLVGGESAGFVCTMVDAKNFICGGKKTNVVGIVHSSDALRMCWSVSGDKATSGCANLTRPN
jgi:hypothetical protein